MTDPSQGDTPVTAGSSTSRIFAKSPNRATSCPNFSTASSDPCRNSESSEDVTKSPREPDPAPVDENG